MPPRDVPGLLLINLGTPQAPRVPEVRRYLREFLSDWRVLDVPWPVRWAVLHLAILPRRPRASAHAYAKVWTRDGSPLRVHGRELARKVQERLGASAKVELAMRYGVPSIAEAMRSLQQQGVGRIVVFPLYPQHSSAATGSSLEAVFAAASRLWNVPRLQIVPPFYDDPRYIACFAEVAEPALRDVDAERVFFSFHGLPERQIRKSDPTGSHCLARPDCCERAPDERPEVAAECYRAQCVTTARLLADKLGVPRERCTVCFQSRLGSTPWIRPFTDLEIRDAAARGVKRAVIVVPSFVADCLETLEEIGLRAVEDWRAHGGETLRLVPSLNAADSWVDAVVGIARDSSSWLARPDA
jgi:protoporphyrin/coproporphyrin ferrochelatase